MKNSILVCVIFFLVAGVLQPALADTLVARATGDVGGVTFQLDVMEQQQEAPSAPSRHKEKKTGALYFREVVIHCIQGCESDVLYNEKTPDNLVGAFRIRDDSRDFITIWASGSAYWVRVYHIEGEGGRISKVLDAATKSAPQFKLSENGGLLIILDNPDSPNSVWAWDGKKYDSIPTPKNKE